MTDEPTPPPGPMVVMATVDDVWLPVRSIHFERGLLLLGAVVEGPAKGRARRPAVIELREVDGRRLDGRRLARWVQTVEWDAVADGCSTTVVLETCLHGGE